MIAAGVVWWGKAEVTAVFSLSLAAQGIIVLLFAPLRQDFATYAFWVSKGPRSSGRVLNGRLVQVLWLGLSYGVTTALTPSAVLELVGLSELNAAFGFQLFAEGVAGCLGAPFAGRPALAALSASPSLGSH